MRVVANVGSTWFWGGTEPRVGRGVRPGTRATHCGREQGLSAERGEEPKPAPRSRATGAFVPPCSLRRCGRRADRRPSRNPLCSAGVPGAHGHILVPHPTAFLLLRHFIALFFSRGRRSVFGHLLTLTDGSGPCLLGINISEGGF